MALGSNSPKAFLYITKIKYGKDQNGESVVEVSDGERDGAEGKKICTAAMPD